MRQDVDRSGCQADATCKIYEADLPAGEDLVPVLLFGPNLAAAAAAAPLSAPLDQQGEHRVRARGGLVHDCRRGRSDGDSDQSVHQSVR